jgi:hypothetical protein
LGGFIITSPGQYYAEDNVIIKRNGAPSPYNERIINIELKEFGDTKKVDVSIEISGQPPIYDKTLITTGASLVHLALALQTCAGLTKLFLLLFYEFKIQISQS